MDKGDILICIKEVGRDVTFHYRGNTYDEDGYNEYIVYYEKGGKYEVDCDYWDDRWDSSPIITIKRPIKDAVELGLRPGAWATSVFNLDREYKGGYKMHLWDYFVKEEEWKNQKRMELIDKMLS